MLEMKVWSTFESLFVRSGFSRLRFIGWTEILLGIDLVEFQSCIRTGSAGWSVLLAVMAFLEVLTVRSRGWFMAFLVSVMVKFMLVEYGMAGF